MVGEVGEELAIGPIVNGAPPAQPGMTARALAARAVAPRSRPPPCWSRPAVAAGPITVMHGFADYTSVVRIQTSARDR
jgi:hypothetical protein